MKRCNKKKNNSRLIMIDYISYLSMTQYFNRYKRRYKLHHDNLTGNKSWVDANSKQIIATRILGCGLEDDIYQANPEILKAVC